MGDDLEPFEEEKVPNNDHSIVNLNRKFGNFSEEESDFVVEDDFPIDQARQVVQPTDQKNENRII